MARPPWEMFVVDSGELGVEIGTSEIAVWLVRSPTDTDLIQLPIPRGGYGGHEVVISDDERFAVLWLHSGQSEVGYELFALAPELRHLGSLPYERGVGDAPQFSEDGRWLVMLVRDGGRDFYSGDDLWGSPAEQAETGRVWRLDWATLYVERVPQGERRSIYLAVETTTPPDRAAVEGWNTFGRRITIESMGDGAVATIALPWGKVAEVDLSRSNVVLAYP